MAARLKTVSTANDDRPMTHRTLRREKGSRQIHRIGFIRFSMLCARHTSANRAPALPLSTGLRVFVILRPKMPG
jgi:hypothetical protein